MTEFQQIFLRWLEKERARIILRPIFDEFDGKNLIFRIDQVTPSIAVIVCPSSVRVDVFKHRVKPLEPWDSLFQRNECKFVSCPSEAWVEGYACSSERHDHLCHSASVQREIVLAEHCFEPLKDWIADELDPAYWLLFSDYESYGSASLEKENETEQSTDGDEEGDYERRKIKMTRKVGFKLAASLRQRNW